MKKIIYIRSIFSGLLMGSAGGMIALEALSAADTNAVAAAKLSAEREIVRRKENALIAQTFVRQGEQALRNREYAKATQAHLTALRLMAPSAVSSRQAVKFSAAALRYTNELIENGRYAQAVEIIKTILQYDPKNRAALQRLSQLRKSNFFDPAITADFMEGKKKIVHLLTEAEGLAKTGRTDLAQKRYERILNIDPYNIEAREGQKRLHERKSRYYQQSYLENRAHLLRNVTKGWEQPIPVFQNDRTISQDSRAVPLAETEEILAKLNKITLPKIELHDCSLREAIDFLKQRARELDPVPGGKGVNIVLKLETEEKFPSRGTEGEFIAKQEKSAPERKKIDLSLTNIPLYEALRYVSELAGLKLKIERYAVSIVPLSEGGDQLLTKEYHILPNFLPTKSSAASLNSTEQNKTPWIRMGAQEYLRSQGVPFPNGAFANYVSNGSRLIVRNTSDALNLIDSIVDAANRATPVQVQIEAKFVNITQNNLKELGFDWLLGPLSIPSGLTLSGGAQSPPAAEHYPFVDPVAGFPTGGNSITSNLRRGIGTSPNAAISANSVSSFLAQTLNGNLAMGGVNSLFGISGIFTRPQFQMVIRALSQLKGVDLVSAPKVTARSGQKATVKMIRAFPYPTEFHPPQIPRKGIVASNDVLTNNAFISQTVTPATPLRFEVRNTGITMEVEPLIGPDGFTIDLSLSPEVVEFEGFVDYGVPILGVVNQAVTGIPTTTVLTQNPIQQPIFSTRKVTTSVSIWDGQTVALGGLMREDVQKVRDKVPFLGDIPLLGQLFRSSSEQKIKENLIIFVTARLVDAQDNPVHLEEDAEPLPQSARPFEQKNSREFLN
ncbi:MAG: type II and III secretion system protein [Verrucomicrobia bacterium]|nr:MAG: type II and III secretion system protein [Verrucomicrobiota bacterium]